MQMKFVENIQETLYTQNLAILRHLFRYFIAVTIKSKLLDLSFQFATPVENILFTLLCTLHQPNSIDQCLFLAVVNFILAATQVRYF